MKTVGEAVEMLYFRDEEKRRLKSFSERGHTRAMAVYGRRRTGKTALMLDYLAGDGKGTAMNTSFVPMICSCFGRRA